LVTCPSRNLRRPCQNQVWSCARCLERIGAIFAIEREINGSTPGDRLAVRQARSIPLLAELRINLENNLARVSKKGDLAKAFRYCLNHWTALTRFILDGRLEISNDAAERAIRPLTLGRRNWTFLGSDTGGDRAAVFFTIIQTCKLNGVNPEAYLTDIIRRIAQHPARQINQLLP
jgi:transposase